LASVFPDQVACAENLPGELEIPDHPLVRQPFAIAWKMRWMSKASSVVAQSGIRRDSCRGARSHGASPLALEVLSARPYAYLDDAPLEERRTQAVMSRRWMDPESAADIGKLDMDAIKRVRERLGLMPAVSTNSMMRCCG
jgi:ATP-dependent Lhr-like helicase